MSMPERPPEGTDEQLWNAVVEARRQFLEHQFGPLPLEIHKLLNLSGIWPGGGIYQLAAARLGGMGVCATFGLTNSDMPATVKIASADYSAGRVATTLEARAPREVPPGLAGYGYELLILTPQPDPWPLLALSWFVQMEILNDIDLLRHLAAGNGVTVDGVKLGDGSRSGNFLVQTACAPILGRVNLPNGLMHVLVATWITDDELRFAQETEDGRWELLDHLLAGGVGPVSILDRPSVLTR